MIHLKIVRGDDGGTRSAGTLALTDCELRDNHAGDGGGAIDGEGSSTVQLRFSSGVNLSISGTFEHTGRLTRTFDWQRASMTFVAPPSGSVVIACRIGFYGI